MPPPRAQPSPAPCPNDPGITWFTGPDAATRLVQSVEADLVVAAIVGAAGLPSTLAAIERGRTVALANKETLVAAGPLVMPKVRQHHATLLPIDSEHSAIWQCASDLRPSPHADQTSPPPPVIRKIILTASGGPFRTASKNDIDHATPKQALQHPTWSMGPKITIDSATMMNKALEVIEAHHLFGLPSTQIQVLVHKQSCVHGLVEFADGSVLAQMGPPDMKTPIQVALTWPNRLEGCGEPLDFTTLSRLDFEPPDPVRFPALDLATRVIDQGGTAGATLNAANEAAVEAFLNHRIPMGRITELVTEALDAFSPQPLHDLDDVFHADRQAREFVAHRLTSTTAATS